MSLFKKKMKILVTGSKGFVGKHLLQGLRKNNYHATGLYRSKNNGENQENLIDCDLRDKSTLDSVLKDFDIVFHCAGKVGDYGSWSEYYNNNYIASKNIIEACSKNKVDKIIHLSSQTVYGIHPFDKKILVEDDPITIQEQDWAMYTKSKQMTEHLFTKDFKDKINFTIFRPGIIYGPEDFNFLPRYIDFSRKNILIGGGNNSFNLIYIENLVNQLIDVGLNDNGNNEIYNVCDEPNLSQKEVHKVISEKLGNEKKPIKIPYPLAFYAASIYENIHQFMNTKSPLLVSKYGVYIIANQNRLDSTKINNEFDSAKDIAPRDALDKTLGWYDQNTKVLKY